MKIDILCNDGSPIGVILDDVYGKAGRIGVGGAELALLTMCEYWANIGHKVVLYNNPRLIKEQPFEQRHISSFNPKDNRDVLIVFRSPNPLALIAKGKKVWWSCDQYTVGDFKAFSKQVDEIVVISPFHAQYFFDFYGIDNVHAIDLAVRQQDYTVSIEKNPMQCLFSSVPDRGLPQLAKAWGRVIEQVPNAELVITSGWSLWTGNNTDYLEQKYRLLFAGMPGVKYLSAIKREELVQEQLRSSLLTYPCVYNELFCISCAEAQVAGAWPITSKAGALFTTNMGTMLGGSPMNEYWIEDFAKHIVDRLNNPLVYAGKVAALQKKAIERFSLERINSQWEKILFS